MKKSRLIFEVQFEIGKIKKCIFSHAVTDTPSSEVFDTRKILVNLFKIIFFWAAFCILLDLLKLDVRLRRSKKNFCKYNNTVCIGANTKKNRAIVLVNALIQREKRVLLY